MAHLVPAYGGGRVSRYEFEPDVWGDDDEEQWGERPMMFTIEPTWHVLWAGIVRLVSWLTRRSAR